MRAYRTHNADYSCYVMVTQQRWHCVPQAYTNAQMDLKLSYVAFNEMPVGELWRRIQITLVILATHRTYRRYK